MIRRRCIHFLASDAHDLSYRTPDMRAARQRLESLVGAEEAKRMVEDNPAALLEGREVRAGEPIEDDRRGSGSGLRGWLGRLGLGRT
jgi:protein-tyrosine phosphatase